MGFVSSLLREFRGPVSKLTVRVRMPGMRQLRRLLKSVDSRATSASDSIAKLNSELESLGDRLTVRAISGEVLELIERETSPARGGLELPEVLDDRVMAGVMARAPVENVAKPQPSSPPPPVPSKEESDRSGYFMESGRGVHGPVLKIHESIRPIPRDGYEAEMAAIGQLIVETMCNLIGHRVGIRKGDTVAVVFPHKILEKLIPPLRGSLMPKIEVDVPMPRVKPPRARSVDLRGSSLQAYAYREHLIDILAELYESELNVRIESFWDEGWKVSLGDEMNGFVTTWEEDTLGAAITGIESEVLIHYPKSEFALKRTGHRDKGGTMSEERMGTFALVRHEDETGISGTGTVAEGVRFRNGKCAMAWLTDVSSVAVYDSMKDLIKIHGHNGKTEVVWHD